MRPPAPDPAPVLELLEGFRRSQVLFAAVELGVFDRLPSGGLPLTELASQIGCCREALGRLLDSCVEHQLLTKVGETYQSTPLADTFLRAASPQSVTGYVRFSQHILGPLWSHLADAVREGSHRWKQAFGLEGPIFSSHFQTPQARREFLLGMHGYGMISSPAVVSAVDLSDFTTLVDLGGASGHLAMAACDRHPHLRGIVYELPEALELARELVPQHPARDRITLAAGDFFTDPLPAADLFALGRILHDWSDDKATRLLARIFDRLPARGGILIAEKVLLDDKTGPRWAQLQSLNMLVCTEGKERSLPEYQQLLSAVGFVDVELFRTPSPLDAVLARKPANAPAR